MQCEVNNAVQWYTLYAHRRRIDIIALRHLSHIISTPSERTNAITALIAIGDEVNDVLKIEAECRLPWELRGVWNTEEMYGWEEGEGEWWQEMDGRDLRGDWIERRRWAREALG